MAVELVLLSGTAPTREDWEAAATAVIPGGDLHELVDGSCLIRDNNNDGILTWWPPRPLIATREAAWTCEDARAWQVWTDIALPYAGSRAGRAICAELAHRLGGRVMERK
ncbi:hypothetical protein [Propionibacterium australiense]|uniref:Uncharacterized protein n=1 Tax=Propionibacterium australiense TaxID=119981 RepID=A0A383SAN1_9ACTN|nr:hypothetical protein [Propionibacterium australiense]RLP06007.1 hypothetical protein D9T14_12900 [Propionibacterium australiense]RLP06222.1 hypothetical protein D7U36_13155 [Propionibacterium australiense]SYZ34276.1 Hypothetical protein PROPAUS_2281 [Propionibacterium australiense]VEH92187.1 Uncharacterised protein [Propionibacterium australiense]